MKQERIQDLRTMESRLTTTPRTLDCKVCTRAEAQREGMEWRDTVALIDDGEPNYDAVADMAAEYCFVR